MTDIRSKAEQALHEFIGEDKQFRPGQYEAIEATLTNKRTLVVQRTGWGKSMVYFVCTKLLRSEGKGVTLIISPLLSLMTNQIDSAAKAGLKCEVLNSSKSLEEKSAILDDMKQNRLDIVLTTPETLFTKQVQEALPMISIGLFVIDEAHCISDWGHDFRLDYCRLNRVIGSMLRNVPVLATTATANDRVVDDLKKQLGGDVFVSRGQLMRDNLSIQVLKLEDKPHRYAWLLDNINRLNGSGIVYCLTQQDCNEIAGFLTANGISARAYHSGLPGEENEQSEALFMDNRVKALVATIKLGMGYDKGDIAFVIHYQMPQNIVAYYQQIGRAGRNIDRAYTFLLSGREDLDIQKYFRDTAFPTELESKSVYNCIAQAGGAKLYEINSRINMAKGRIENTLKFLVNEELVYKENSKYYITANLYKYNEKHYREITQMRIREQKQMLELLETTQCYNRFVVNALDDKTACNCGLCGNCLGYEEYPSAVTEASLIKAEEYLDKLIMRIEPRTKWAKTSTTGMTKIDKPNEPGICLSRYGHPLYGELVRQGKYQGSSFCARLVEKSAEVLSDFISEHEITALTYVPSQRSGMVSDFALRLSEKLGISCLSLLKKSNSNQQKDMENSSFQCENALKSFSLAEGAVVPEKILLVDDMVDSRWTLTVCGYILRSAGAEQVYPYALASTSKKDD